MEGDEERIKDLLTLFSRKYTGGPENVNVKKDEFKSVSGNFNRDKSAFRGVFPILLYAFQNNKELDGSIEIVRTFNLTMPQLIMINIY